MAIGTHGVPVLRDAGPVQNVVVGELLVGLKMEPALAAFLARPRVPGDIERLVAPLGKRDQILL
ncbi:hypothetical protein D3C83_287340 [compost metagenome]